MRKLLFITKLNAFDDAMVCFCTNGGTITCGTLTTTNQSTQYVQMKEVYA